MGLITSASGGGTNGGTTGSVNTTGATFLVAVVMWYTGGGSLTLSDSKSNTWTHRTRYDNTFAAGCRISYVENPTVGSSHTFTLSGSGTYSGVVVGAFDGVLTASVYDGVENGAVLGSAGTSLQTGSITPASNYDLVIAALGIGNGLTNIGIDSGFSTPVTLLGSASRYGASMAYLYQTSASAVNPTWSWTTSSQDVAASIAAFKGVVPASFPVRTLLGVGR